MRTPKISVVIVDDNDMMRTVLRGILRGEEYDVVGEARNGAQAVEVVERMKPDIVCMDVLMPEKNGLEAMAEIKMSRPETEFVMITGSADPETVQDAIMNGASGFIVKPFNAARVLDALKKSAARLRQRS
ncbi:two-component system chemotaxis response regulator CheY [Azonexus fungiphilus]|jgi:two-component system chemotaxis response regulator CheY|uniref:Two-component system chemotaxis response regulator CheY n=1 Tax=Azonexus fungiphilus TaxID=146940 RepID=A0A495WIG5_9RHOO|nr:response regulator [Azonexus fungiphilus]RKT60904.1 two-component system chemotaxis response regulator CheY [Azonexus fungiphilus]